MQGRCKLGPKKWSVGAPESMDDGGPIGQREYLRDKQNPTGGSFLFFY